MRFLRAVKRRYGLASRRMAVRTHVAWHWRGLFLAAALGTGAALAWWMYDVSGHSEEFDRGAAEQEMSRLRERLGQLETEIERLRSVQVKVERSSQIDNAAQRDLVGELKTVRDENASLKEELAFYRGIASGEHAPGMSIYRFTVDRREGGGYHYQLMLVQDGRGAKVFQGRLQLAVTAQGAGGAKVVLFPAGGPSEKFSVSLKTYQKLEGDFQLAPSAQAKSVEARIFADGSAQPKLTKTVSLM